MRILSEPREPNHVHLVWAVRRLTPIQAKYIGMFYGDETVAFLRFRPPASRQGPF
jgi:hypothetical protein